MKTPPKILVVCTANICRSPVAEALLRNKLQSAGVEDWIISSAGTWAGTGNLAAPFSQELLLEQGIDIRHHRSQPVTTKLLQEADLVICMETDHIKTLLEAFPAFHHKYFTIRQIAGKRGSVRDPYGGTRKQYAQMVSEVDALLTTGISHIRTLVEKARQGQGTNGSDRTG